MFSDNQLGKFIHNSFCNQLIILKISLFSHRYENKRSRVAYVPGDMLQNNETYFGGVVEPYWLSSNGIAIWVPSGTPLFYSWNEGNEVYPNDKLMCLQAKNVEPYPTVEQYPELGNPAQLRLDEFDTDENKSKYEILFQI